MTILEERGLFWWHGEPVPDRKFAPDASVLGLLTIDDDGLATLALDGCMPSEKGPMAVLSRDPEELKGKLIEGNLSTSGKHILLADLAKRGGTFRSNNLSQEGYRAIHCLASYSAFPPINDNSLFNVLKIDLTGLEGWLRLGSIETVRTESTIDVSYRRRDPVIYEIDEGRLIVEYDILGPRSGRSRDNTLSLTEKASLVYCPKSPMNLEAMRQQFRELEDLFIIMTNSEYNFLWPTVSLVVGGKNHSFEWFSYRKRSSANPPSWHECLTNFVKLKDNFGNIVSSWIKKRGTLGPGFYIYVGVRRAEQTYVEQRFLNLISGIEALHRRKNVTSNQSEILAKIDRILGQIALTKDRTWLQKRLKNAHEPNLAQRIYDVLSSVPLNIRRTLLRKFSIECADLRNDLSHFGAQKTGITYNSFIVDLAKKSEALSIIYHMVILHEIGIDDQTVNEWIYERSFPAKASLVEAGLLDETVLKPPAPLVLPKTEAGT